MPTQAADHPHISRDVQQEDGKMIQAKRTLRAWEAQDNLNVKGMFRSTVTTNKGATCKSWVYVAAGHRPKLLLGDEDMGKRGIVRFSLEGKEPTKKERKGEVRKMGNKNTASRIKGKGLKAASIRNKPRNAGNKIKMGTWELHKINPKDKAQASDIVEDHRASVFRPGVVPRSMTP